MVEQRHVHWVVVKHVFGYPRGIVRYGPRYVSDGEVTGQGVQWI